MLRNPKTQRKPHIAKPALAGAFYDQIAPDDTAELDQPDGKTL
jgi:hypothetical protein